MADDPVDDLRTSRQNGLDDPLEWLDDPLEWLDYPLEWLDYPLDGLDDLVK